VTIRIELEGIIQEFPTGVEDGVLRVIGGVDLVFDGPGINMLLGPSGCGKSTLLKMMGGVRPLGIQVPTQGEVRIDGTPCHGTHDDVVTVFQQYLNRKDLTVRENVAFPFRFRLWRKRIPKAEQAKRVDDALSAVGLQEQADLRPGQLSGGQNQRVALARALVLQPRILLMDEPFGALDAQIREDMQQLLLDLWQKQQCTVVFITHDIEEALRLGDRIIVLDTRPATVAADIRITEPRPRSPHWFRSTEGDRIARQIRAILRGGGAH
jgi:ABC-type nitrate/sulfonate/bicarbonate transport system ATPase subunit